jgi:hypothetical protein
MSAMEIPQPHTAPSPSARWICWAALLLSLPALLPLAGALIVPHLNNMVPTGFIEYDLPSYLAEGRAYFERGFHFTYGNPYAGYDTPAIYFQPQTMVLGLMQQLGFDPGLTFNLFGLLALFFAAAIAVLFYIEVVGVQTTARKIGLVCFFWGGGIFTLVGLALALARGRALSTLWQFEPTLGWWMLNFGRNLVYPTEAYYHGVFLLSLLALIRGRLALSLVFAALLCCSHPFTGLTLILILIAYSGLELAMRSGAVTLRFLFGAILIAALHLAYYMIWLNRFSDHRVLQSQWQKAWLYPPKTIVAALIIVGSLAIWRVARSKFRCFHAPRNRLFAVWFLVVIALTQHNLVMRPIQPIHFAHGYDWTALFFLGAPILIAAIDGLLNITRPWARRGALALLMAFFLLDNAAWLVEIAVHNEFLVFLTKDQSAALIWLSRNLRSGDMVVCQDTLISYLVPTYSPARAWQGHEHNTPFIERRRDEIERIFSQVQVLPEWKRHGVYFVSSATWVPPSGLSVERRFGNSEFVIWAFP